MSFIAESHAPFECGLLFDRETILDPEWSAYCDAELKEHLPETQILDLGPSFASSICGKLFRGVNPEFLIGVDDDLLTIKEDKITFSLGDLSEVKEASLLLLPNGY